MVLARHILRMMPMSWKSLATPLAVIIVGVVFTIVALSVPEGRAGVGPRGQNLDQDPTEDTSNCGSYPNAEVNYIPDRCKNLTTTPQTTTTSAPAGTGTPTATTTATTTAGTVAPSAPTFVAPTRSATPILPPTVGPIPTEESASAEVTPTPDNALICAPGEPVLITGEGPPRAAFLLYFDQRAVGGGSVSLSGSFSIPLVVGRERPGSYPVTVRVRGSEQVLRELTCEVPPSAPPTPIEGAFPQ
jgi:hypothetical protein